MTRKIILISVIAIVCFFAGYLIHTPRIEEVQILPEDAIIDSAVISDKKIIDDVWSGEILAYEITCTHVINGVDYKIRIFIDKDTYLAHEVGDIFYIGKL